MSVEHTVEDYDSENREYDHYSPAYLNHTHDKLLEILQPELKESDVILDASCGTGLLASRLLELKAPFRKLVLNDESPRMLETAHERLPSDDRLSFTSYPPDQLPFEESHFTRVLCLNAFHHYDRPSSVARQFKRIMPPDGQLYLVDRNRAGWVRAIDFLLRWSGKEPVNTWHLDEVIRLLQEHEFTIEMHSRWNYRQWQLFMIKAGFF